MREAMFCEASNRNTTPTPNRVKLMEKDTKYLKKKYPFNNSVKFYLLNSFMQS